VPLQNVFFTACRLVACFIALTRLPLGVIKPVYHLARIIAGEAAKSVTYFIILSNKPMGRDRTAS
jgi:hypothetical protein